MPVLVALCFVLLAPPAFAYGGPGVAIALLGSVFGLAGAIAGAIFFALLYPAIFFYRYVKMRRARREIHPEDKAT